MKKKELIEITKKLIKYLLKCEVVYRWENSSVFRHPRSYNFHKGICDAVSTALSYKKALNYRDAITDFQTNKGRKSYGYWFPRDERTIERRLEFLREYLEYLQK